MAAMDCEGLGVYLGRYHRIVLSADVLGSHPCNCYGDKEVTATRYDAVVGYYQG